MENAEGGGTNGGMEKGKGGGSQASSAMSSEGLQVGGLCSHYMRWEERVNPFKSQNCEDNLQIECQVIVCPKQT